VPRAGLWAAVAGPARRPVALGNAPVASRHASSLHRRECIPSRGHPASREGPRERFLNRKKGAGRGAAALRHGRCIGGKVPGKGGSTATNPRPARSASPPRTSEGWGGLAPQTRKSSTWVGWSRANVAAGMPGDCCRPTPGG
jgi:hypothetical protein